MGSRLTSERITELAEYLFDGLSKEEIAKTLNVSVRTVFRWQDKPAVLAELERLRNRNPAAVALEKLVRLCDSDDEKIALGAAQTLVRREMQRFAANAGLRR